VARLDGFCDADAVWKWSPYAPDRGGLFGGGLNCSLGIGPLVSSIKRPYIIAGISSCS
jgi:hypothetical protein